MHPPKVDSEALTVAMAIAPAAYARNRMFAFFTHPEVRRAKRRASLLRGLARQLAGAQGPVEDLGVERRGATTALSYRIASLHLERRAELSGLEAACVAYLAGRGGATALPVGLGDRALLQEALHRLAAGLSLRGVPTPELPPELSGE